MYYRSDNDPGAYIINVSEHTFRQQFANLVARIGLDPDKATPYSLRRGGATQHFRDGWSFTAIAELGRWGSEADCREYINDAGAELALLSLTTIASRRIEAAEAAFESAIS